jgi:hypothetical protein
VKPDDRKEMLRLVELEYERTTKFIDGSVGTTTSLRGWAITVWAGLIGLAFTTKTPLLAFLAVVAVLAFAVVDAYSSSLYQQTLRRARELERITNDHFDALARGSDNPRVQTAADASLAAHNYGLYANMRAVRFRESILVKPQRFIAIYAVLAAVAIVSGLIAAAAPPASSPAPLPTATSTSPVRSP